MNIYFDARWTRTNRHDGISRYGSELAGALAKQHPITLLICDKAQLKLLPPGIPYVLVNHPMSLRELRLPAKLNRLGADIVFSPLQIIGLWGRKYKLILTLQDLIYYRYPKPPAFLPAVARPKKTSRLRILPNDPSASFTMHRPSCIDRRSRQLSKKNLYTWAPLCPTKMLNFY